METVVIRIRPETREKLKALGRKGETYDSIIWRLIEACGEKLRRDE